MTTQITADVIANSAVTTTKIANGAVTSGKLDASVSASITAEITAAVASATQALVPSGSMINYGGAAAPSGWLLCYGQAVSRTTYSALFTAIGTTHGAGNGSTTFNLPDCRGRVIAGKDDMGGVSAARLSNISSTTLGAAGGLQTHTLSTSEMPSHTHSHTDIGGNSGTGAGESYGAGGFALRLFNKTTGSTGSDGAHNNIQPTLILNVIIKT